jgi:hypothetical protein
LPCHRCRVPRPASRESKVSLHWAVERTMHGFDSAQNSLCAATTHANSEHTIGAMDESSERRALTSIAVLSWILQPSKFATPWTLTPPPCEPRERGQAPSIGAMEEMSQKVQNANTHRLPRQNHSNRSAQGSVQGRWMKVQGVQDASTHHQQCCRGYCSLQSLPLRWKRHRRHRPASRESKVKLHP